MNLHHDAEVFEELIELASQEFNLPSSAVRKDYFITLILQNLEKSEFVECVVFKGGTSLSKCYPNSIERFSEDIDLTFIPEEGMSDGKINTKLKNIEKALIGQGKSEKINGERNNRNKSCYVWFSDEYREIESVKLEIGSSVKPHPYSKKILKSYIHEYLENIDSNEAIGAYEFISVELNVLDIKRTFIDKIMSVKRHALCGTLPKKVRHLYDVVRLYELEEIQDFLKGKDGLKSIIDTTKNTDLKYLEKRDLPEEYNPLEAYAFETWKDKFDEGIKANYESLHKDLLYTDEQQDWETAIAVFESINQILKEIEE